MIFGKYYILTKNAVDRHITMPNKNVNKIFGDSLVNRDL